MIKSMCGEAKDVACAVKRHLAPVFIVVLLLISLNSFPASACECSRYATLDEELERSDVIFAGKALTVQSRINGSAEFEVLQVWRGSVSRIALTSNTWDCMDVFRVGEEYLIFAHQVRDPQTMGYQFQSYGCGQTRRLDDSQEALSVLGASSPPLGNSKSLSKLSAIVFAILIVLASVIIFRKLRARPRFIN